MTRRRAAIVLALAALGLFTGCGSDDGAGVRSEGQGSGSGSAGSASGSGSGSGSGLSGADLGEQATDPQLASAVTEYRTYVLGEADGLRADTKKFTDAVRAGNLAAARAQFAPSRVRWERIEPIAGLVEEIDGAVDARVDDFASPRDPTWTGWHRLEHLLWVGRTTTGGKPFADKLDKDIATLNTELKNVEITPKAVALGAGELIEEVSKGKITGEEDRYSHTDLWDFAANVEGSKAAYEVFASILAEKDSGLKSTLERDFAAVEKSLAPYRSGDGFRSYSALTAADKSRMQAQLATLSEDLAKLPAALEVE